MKIEELKARLLIDNDYSQFNLKDHPDDVQGWLSDDPVLRDLVKLIRPSVIVEVGTWKGRSAINFANYTKELNINCGIVCVDTWLGSPEHYLRVDESKSAGRPSLRFVNGYPRLYETFLANIIRRGLEQIVLPLPCTSDNAAMIFESRGVMADICYLDAAHEKDSVFSDLKHWWPIVGDDGVLVGDDFDYWPGVRQAVTEFTDELGIGFYWKEGKFCIFKDQRLIDLKEMTYSLK